MHAAQRRAFLKMRATISHPRVVAHREVFNPESMNLKGVDRNEVAHVRPIVEDMLKQFNDEVVVLGTDDPQHTIISIQGKKKDDLGNPVWTEHLSVIDWCNRYHNPAGKTEFNNLIDTRIVPREIVLHIQKRSAASVPEEAYTRAPAATKRAAKRIRVFEEDEDDEYEEHARSAPETTRRRAYRPPPK